MSESNQPFTEHVTRSKTAGPHGALGWIMVGLIVLLLLMAVGEWMVIHRDRAAAAEIKAESQKLAADLATAQVRRAESQKEIEGFRARVAELEKEKEMAAQMARGLEEQMRADLESKDVTISKLQGKLTVNILDRILFDSGEAELKPVGEVVLRKIASILTQHPELKVHVIGHTDNVPIRATARSRFASNWELSTARALAAVRFLTERAGVAPQRLGAVGYGEFRPIADNTSVEGRARNRRIAITILADELAGADTPSGVTSGGSTNAPLPQSESPSVERRN